MNSGSWLGNKKVPVRDVGAKNIEIKNECFRTQHLHKIYYACIQMDGILKRRYWKKFLSLTGKYLFVENLHNPIAIIEAEDNNHSVNVGIQRALNYATVSDILCVLVRTDAVLMPADSEQKE